MELPGLDHECRRHAGELALQAEDPEAQPAKGWMDRFESVGLPTYAIVQAADR